MTILWQFMALLAAHWIADFLLQTHWQASNKSKNLEALARHVVVYSVFMGMVAMLLLGWEKGVLFCAATFVTHFATDYCTSRWSSRLWAKQDWHNFFVVVGLDQLIHQVTLALTLWWLIR